MELLEVKSINLAKDDVLMVRVTCPLNYPKSRMVDYFNHIKDELKSVFPNNKVVILSADIDITKVTPEN